MPWIELASPIEDEERGYEYTTLVKFSVEGADAGNEVTPATPAHAEFEDARVLVAECYDESGEELRTERGAAARRHDERVVELITGDPALLESVEDYCLRNEDVAETDWIVERDRPAPRMAASRRTRRGQDESGEAGVA